MAAPFVLDYLNVLHAAVHLTAEEQQIGILDRVDERLRLDAPIQAEREALRVVM